MLGDGGVLIKCKDKKQRETEMKLTKMVDKAKKTGDEPFVRGVIYGGKVIYIKCLQARR